MGRKTPSTTPHILKKNGMVPATTKKDLAKILEEHSGIKDIFVDGVERSIQRSSSPKNQKKDYS